MLDEEAFRDLIRRARNGDAQAATELVREYEPEIRREVRVRLDPRMRTQMDSTDVCQSILGNFFVRIAMGEFELEHPAQLFKLLVTMTKNRIEDHRRKHQSAKRDMRRQQAATSGVLEGVAADVGTPSQIIEARELVEKVRQHLSPEERELAELRGQGKEWAEIAAERNDSPERLRKKYTRALDRVAEELGLGDSLIR